MVKRYRKRPIIIDAIKFTQSSVSECLDFCKANIVKYTTNDQYYIKTLEGDMLIREGDYIIRGVNGEFYPCASDIFHKTYEEV